MRIIALMTHSADFRNILNHSAVEPQPPHIAPARGLPLQDDCDAQKDDDLQVELNWDLAAQPAPPRAWMWILIAKANPDYH